MTRFNDLGLDSGTTDGFPWCYEAEASETEVHTDVFNKSERARARVCVCVCARVLVFLKYHSLAFISFFEFAKFQTLSVFLHDSHNRYRKFPA